MEEAHEFTVTHPFHPLKGQTFLLFACQSTWREPSCRTSQELYDSTLVQLSSPLSLPLPAMELFRLPARCKALSEIIDRAV
jgi:hypothetical protein